MSRLTPLQIGVNLVLSVVLIVGAYQFYFFTQRHRWREPRVFHSPLDERIPFVPAWSWVYSFLYYPAILYLNVIAQSVRHFVMMAFAFIVLLGMQMVCFTLFPVATPPHWRQRTVQADASVRFLGFVQRFDSPANCFPSMHTSVATLTACLAWDSLGPGVAAFPLLIAISCAFTKQHYLLDLPAGAALGVAAHRLHLLLY